MNFDKLKTISGHWIKMLKNEFSNYYTTFMHNTRLSRVPNNEKIIAS